MAADQRRKRLNGASIVGGSSREHYKGKKRNTGFQQNVHLKSHISLEWDGNRKRVIAKKEQVGIRWREMGHFINSVPYCHNILADVTSVPQETFDLKNLDDVLSHEVWQTNLSENERNWLMHFLPTGQEAQQVVQSLLSGENFHFGNPFLKWGASLCSGNLHPDAVLFQERTLKVDKKAYYSEIHKYHNDTIEYLHKLKESWESCNDPEMGILQNRWRQRNNVEKIPSSKEFRLRDLEENVADTSESSSWEEADEKACSSGDTRIFPITRVQGIRERRSEKSLLKDKNRKPLVASGDTHNVGARPSKGDKLLKCNIHSSDGSKYMSYVKVSKKQHELFKSMKQAGKCIQFKSLHRVLGNIDAFNVQPYEVFVEEEQEKLHEQWLLLVNRDLIVAHSSWRERQLQRRWLINSLEKDLQDKLSSLMEDEETKDCKSLRQDQMDVRATAHEFTMVHDSDCVPGSPQKQYLYQVSSSDGDYEHPMLIHSDDNNNAVPDSDNAPGGESDYSGNLDTKSVTVSEGDHLSSGADVWPADGNGIPHSYYNSTGSHEYTSASDLPIVHSRLNDKQRDLLVNLESDLHEKDARKDVLHHESNDGPFNSFPNQDRNGLLSSFFRGPVMTSFHQDQKQTGLDFLPPNMFRENGQFLGHFVDPSHLPLNLEQERHNELYMQQNMSRNIYSDGGRYAIPRQEQLAPVNMPDWAINHLSLSAASLQPQLKGAEMLNQNWFSGDSRVRGGWAGSDGIGIRSQDIGSGSNVDHSVYNALSHNPLGSGIPFEPIGSDEQFMPSRNYGMVSEGTSRMSNVLPHTSHQLGYLSVREPATSMMTDETAWITLPQQNAALHDSINKPLLRRWNQ